MARSRWIALAAVAVTVAMVIADDFGNAPPPVTSERADAMRPKIAEAPVKDDRVLKHVTLLDLQLLAVDLNLDVQVKEAEGVGQYLVLEEPKPYLYLLLYGEDGQYDSLGAQAWFEQDDAASVWPANTWNRSQRFTRATVSDQWYLLEQDLDLSGGVTKLSVGLFLLNFRRACDEFAKQIGFAVVAG